MPKCEFVILKGKKKGSTCDIYTSKEANDKKYYCKSHMKMIDKPKESASLPIEEPKQDEQSKEQQDDSIFNIDFENCDLDTLINKSYEKSKNIVKVEDNQTIKNCLHQVLNKLDIIENMIQVKKYKYNPIDDIPEIHSQPLF